MVNKSFSGVMLPEYGGGACRVGGPGGTHIGGGPWGIGGIGGDGGRGRTSLSNILSSFSSNDTNRSAMGHPSWGEDRAINNY